MRFFRAAVLLVMPTILAAQQPERVTLAGREVAVYNLVGKLRVEGGGTGDVVVEVIRNGRDGGRLKVETGDVRGRTALRVTYPEDRIVYRDMNWNARSNFAISDDGTWGDSRDGRWNGRRIEVSSRGDGLEAYADLRVIVPKGKILHVRHGIGETVIDNVDGQLSVDVAAARVRVTRMRGSLTLDSGSGGVEVTDMTGDLNLDAGSGGATLDGIRGGSLTLEVGSGSVRARDLDVTEVLAEVGSGGVQMSRVRTTKLRLETGSGGSDIEMLTAPDDVSIEAGSGGVTLRIPATTSATVDIETGSGSIDSDFEMTLNRIERRSLRGTIGSGKGRIRIESGSGSVRLLRG